jgi:hypothetical protein
MPITPFIGVRISWLIVARNVVRARPATSAASCASCRAVIVDVSERKAMPISHQSARASARPTTAIDAP